jgi:hypothetical protein
MGRIVDALLPKRLADAALRDVVSRRTEDDKFKGSFRRGDCRCDMIATIFRPDARRGRPAEKRWIVCDRAIRSDRKTSDGWSEQAPCEMSRSPSFIGSSGQLRQYARHGRANVDRVDQGARAASAPRLHRLGRADEGRGYIAGEQAVVPRRCSPRPLCADSRSPRSTEWRHPGVPVRCLAVAGRSQPQS